MGGNIGRPVFELEPGPPERVFVLELSSFQLDLCDTLRCRVAVWLNLTPDHLDRHGDLAGLRRRQGADLPRPGEGDVAVIGIDDAPSREVADRLAAQGRACYGDPDGRARRRGRGARRPPARGSGRPTRPRPAAAAEPARAAQLAEHRRGLCGGPGLGLTPARPWRACPASRPAAPDGGGRARRPGALGQRQQGDQSRLGREVAGELPNIFWIAGGKPKPGGFRSLRPALGNVRAGYLIGTAAGEIAADLGDLAPMHHVGTLAAAVRAASAAARAEGAGEAAVLLAPACASYDQFANFEARGEAFRALARAEAAGS